jgi:hypothetical protein
LSNFNKKDGQFAEKMGFADSEASRYSESNRPDPEYFCNLLGYFIQVFQGIQQTVAPQIMDGS